MINKMAVMLNLSVQSNNKVYIIWKKEQYVELQNIYGILVSFLVLSSVLKEKRIFVEPNE